MSLTSARAAYLGNSVSTANPGTLLVMLCDRMLLDVTRARTALAAGDDTEARLQLRHAQDIVVELRTSLDVDGFVGARELAALYDYLLARLLRASIDRDLAVATECHELAGSIAETWRLAAATLARPA